MNEISMKIQKEIDTLQNKYALIGILISIKYDQRNSRISLIKVQGNVKRFVVPDFIEMIGENCFRNNHYIEEVIITNKGFDLILNNAFENCIGLRKVDMSKSGVIKIGAEAFRECKSLTDISLSESLVELDASVFDGCSSLEELELPKGIKRIPFGMCYRCDSLRRVKHSAETIGQNAFRYSSLTEFNFENIKLIEFAAFSESRLKEIRLKDIEVESNAFRNIHGKIKIVEIDNVSAFCIKGIAEISSSIFEDCEIDRLVFKNINMIPNACFSNANINCIENMSLITSIENSAFFASQVSHGINLSNIEYIGYDAFYSSFIHWDKTIELGKNKPIVIETEAFNEAVNMNYKENSDGIPIVLIYNLKSLGDNAFLHFKDNFAGNHIEYKLIN